jgi:hypothetical protein
MFRSCVPIGFFFYFQRTPQSIEIKKYILVHWQQAASKKQAHHWYSQPKALKITVQNPGIVGLIR